MKKNRRNRFCEKIYELRELRLKSKGLLSTRVDITSLKEQQKYGETLKSALDQVPNPIHIWEEEKLFYANIWIELFILVTSP